MTAFGLNQASTNKESPTTSPPNSNNETNPWIVAGEGNLPLLQTIITQQNLSINQPDSNGFTFLHSAASYNQIPTIQWIIKQQSVNVNIQDDDGDTPLHHCDAVEAARILIEEGKVDFHLKNKDGKNVLQVKEEELDDEEDEEDSFEIKELKRLVEYLSGEMMSS